jgi:manganese-dependent inorganic pyrophosphatase
VLYYNGKKGSESMEKIYVFGHQKPDTDSVCSSISYSYLKNQLGFKTEAKVLGHINNESKYALEYFGVKEPEFINDVKVQVRNINYNKGMFVNKNTSIYEAFNAIQQEKLTGVPVVDEKQKLVGLATLKDIARSLIEGEEGKISTSYQNILSVLDGEEVLKFDDVIDGNILGAVYQSKTMIEEITIKRDDILIIGDRYKILEYAVNSKIQLIIITGNHDMPTDLLEIAKKNKVNIIKTKLHTYNTVGKLTLANYISSVAKPCQVTILDTDYQTDVALLPAKYGFTNYPVIDKNGKCLGLLSVSDMNNFEKRKVILVDHNGFSQSVLGIEEAKIEEVIDHHNLLNIGTPDPINFRSMPVGCTCTIIYNMYKENNVDIPKSMAGIMLSAILSDTLLLKSVTTTDYDKTAVLELAKIAGVDYLKYGHEMIKSGFSIKGKNVAELIEEDIKTFKANDKMVGISQIFTMDYEDIKDNMNDFMKHIEDLASGKFDTVIVLITDIVKNGSYVFFDEKSKYILENVFNNDDFKEGEYVQDLLSRKKQLVPFVLELLEK